MKIRFLIGSLLGVSLVATAILLTTTQKNTSTYQPKELASIEAKTGALLITVQTT